MKANRVDLPVGVISPAAKPARGEKLPAGERLKNLYSSKTTSRILFFGPKSAYIHPGIL